jgi:hypothetical protein
VKLNLDTFPQQTRERIAEVGSADLVVGILPSREPANGTALPLVREALTAFSRALRTVVIQNDGSPTNTSGDLLVGDPDSLIVVYAPVFDSDPSVTPLQHVSAAYQSMFAAGAQLGAKACCVVASDLQSVTAQWICRLTQPVLEMDFDLVTPCYGHHKLEGLINTGIISPLSRCLYGRQIQNPLGPDLGFSRRVLQRMVGTDGVPRTTRDRPHPLASLAVTTISAGLSICQAHLGTRLYPPNEPSNVSSLLSEVLGPLFLDMERNATHWQRIRGSQPVPQFGEPARITKEPGIGDVLRMVEAFKLASRNLLEIWRLVLPTTTVFELSKLARLPPEQFRIPDELWVRIVYDFALGYRLRTIGRDHLFGAMTPLYLGWVASYALESEVAQTAGVDQRLERLALAFERAKPYLVSRWRWPDRFNP